MRTTVVSVPDGTIEEFIVAFTRVFAPMHAPAVARSATSGAATSSGKLLWVGASRLLDEYGVQSGVASVQLGLMRQLGYRLPVRFRQPLFAARLTSGEGGTLTLETGLAATFSCRSCVPSLDAVGRGHECGMRSRSSSHFRSSVLCTTSSSSPTREPFARLGLPGSRSSVPWSSAWRSLQTVFEYSGSRDDFVRSWSGRYSWPRRARRRRSCGGMEEWRLLPRSGH